MSEIPTNTPLDARGPNPLVLRLKALRAFSLPVSMLPVPAAAAAILPWRQWDWAVLIAATLGAGLLHLTGNLLNDYFDYRSGVDRKLDEDDNRPGRLLVRGQLRPREVLAEALLCAAAAAPLVAFLVWRVGPGLLWFALAGAVGLYIYTGPPLHLKYRALGEVNIFLVFGPLLTVGAAYSQTGRIEWSVLPLSVAIGCLTTAVLVGNNLRDADEDASGKIRTLAHVIGVPALRGVYAAVTVGPVIGLAAVGALAAAGAIVAPRLLLAAPLTLPLLAAPLRAALAGRRLPDIDARTAKFVTAVLALVIVACIVGV